MYVRACVSLIITMFISFRYKNGKYLIFLRGIKGLCIWHMCVCLSSTNISVCMNISVGERESKCLCVGLHVCTCGWACVYWKLAWVCACVRTYLSLYLCGLYESINLCTCMLVYLCLCVCVRVRVSYFCLCICGRVLVLAWRAMLIAINEPSCTQSPTLQKLGPGVRCFNGNWYFLDTNKPCLTI